MLDQLKSWFGFGSLSDEQFERQRLALLTKTPVPVFWLFGKTGSGKSSIVRYITGATQAEVGNGFRPQTKTSARYDFPSSDQPIVRFLDTRGLGEAGYDPTEDLDAFDDSTDVIVVVARVMDHALAEVLEPLKQIRAARPTRPIVLALTCLHEAYPFEQHPDPDPFGTGLEADVDDQTGKVTPAAHNPWPSALIPPSDLQRCLIEQEARFAGLADRIVPVDLTKPEEGFTQPEFGGRRLEETLIDVLPAACRQAILHLDDIRKSLQDLTAKQALPTIITYSSLAATAAATPLPWVDIPAVMGLQTRLIYVLADLYDQKMNVELLTKMVGAAAGGLALRFAVRAPLKFIPILGHTANAAMAFAYTFSLGKACCWYFGEVRNGHVPSPEDLNKVWGEQLEEAVAVWRKRRGSK
ncbi:MAG: GTPase [Planctomycetota bacterium]